MDGNINQDAVTVQIVINTLETLQIPPTQENVGKLAGIYNLLTELRDNLAAPDRVSVTFVPDRKEEGSKDV